MYILESDFIEKGDKYVFKARNCLVCWESFSFLICIYRFFQNKSDD